VHTLLHAHRALFEHSSHCGVRTVRAAGGRSERQLAHRLLAASHEAKILADIAAASAAFAADESGGKPVLCANGVRSERGRGAVCCAASCGECDGKGCSNRPGGRSGCCGQAIWRYGLTCRQRADVPCILGGAWSRSYKGGQWGLCAEGAAHALNGSGGAPAASEVARTPSTKRHWQSGLLCGHSPAPQAPADMEQIRLRALESTEGERSR
jgi:hypothetical protein